MAGVFARLLLVPAAVLIPLVVMVSFAGIYGISGSSFDLMVMIGFGLLGRVLRKFDVPLMLIILGTLLGNAMENNLRRTITVDNGDWWTLIERPLSICLWIVAIIGFILPVFFARKVRSGMTRADDKRSIKD